MPILPRNINWRQFSDCAILSPELRKNRELHRTAQLAPELAPELLRWLRVVQKRSNNFCDMHHLPSQAGMAELADAADSKSAGLRSLGVRLPLPAPALSRSLVNRGSSQCCPTYPT